MRQLLNVHVWTFFSEYGGELPHSNYFLNFFDWVLTFFKEAGGWPNFKHLRNFVSTLVWTFSIEKGGKGKNPNKKRKFSPSKIRCKNNPWRRPLIQEGRSRKFGEKIQTETDFFLRMASLRVVMNIKSLESLMIQTAVHYKQDPLRIYMCSSFKGTSFKTSSMTLSKLYIFIGTSSSVIL